MSQEITVSQTFNATKGALETRRQSSKQIDMAGEHVSDNAQDIPTTAGGTALVIAAGVATLGWAQFTNLDSTNFVTIGVKPSGTYYPFAKLLPGESFPVRLVPGTTYYALADTATVELEHIVLEN